MHFSSEEIKDLFIAWVLVSIAFAIFMAEGFLPDLRGFFVSLITVGAGFIIHELAHKFVAQRFGKFAEFKASIPMLVVSLLLAFGKILIAAPGAVLVSGFVNRKENGIISVAGPISNIVLCFVFLPIFLLATPGSLMHLIGGFGFGINALLATFNMIPFWIFDGAKVIAWNKLVYGLVVGVGVLLLFAATTLGML